MARWRRFGSVLVGVSAVVGTLLLAPPSQAADAAVPFTGVTQAAAGDDFTCAVRTDRTVWCWGANDYGQLGDATTASRTTPVQVQDLTGVVQLAAGGVHACAVRSDHTVWCWGSNFYGQLGDGTLVDRSVPVQATDLTGVRQVSAGPQDSCAVRSNGTAWCWGLGESGQLGDGTSTSRSIPVRVKRLTGAVQVAATAYVTCARRSDGGVRCWGAGGAQGVLGDGGQKSHVFPVAVKGLPGPVTQLQAGPFNVCALRPDHSVWCWGDNQVGEIGDGTTVNRLVATRSLMSRSVGVKVGFYFTCARATDRSVKCWGYDNYGQLGDGVVTVDSLTPVAVLDLADTASLALGTGHACAVLRDGTMRCWGWNATGQLGNGTTQDSSVPVPVLS